MQSLRSACAYAQSDQRFCLSLEYSMSVKGIDHCPVEIIKGSTDKGVSISHKFKGASSGELPVYNTILFTKIKINILS